VWEDTALRSPGSSTEARHSAIPTSPTERASLLVPGTHRSAECLPERDTLLPTGEGRLLPLCRSSMDLLQGFDLSTELSTVLSTLSKSKLKQKRNATEDLKSGQSHKYTDVRNWLLPMMHPRPIMGSPCKQRKPKRQCKKNFHGLRVSFENPK